jgi:predicted CXXCH cytochrome family protein
MPTIGDNYEVPEYDDDDDGDNMLRPRRNHAKAWIVLLILLAIAAGGVYFATRVTNEQRNDTFCIGCHTEPETEYVRRAGAAMAGALALDLSSSHYQKIRGTGGTLSCIECHEGNASLGHRAEVFLLSARNGYNWLLGNDDRTLEKTRLTVPHLSNDGCLGCHAEKVLVAGMANHQHNMLPVVYELWRNGARLIPPEGTVDKQSIIAAGLVKYATTLQCSDCHQTHRSLETDQYLDRTSNLPTRCVQCHIEVNQGPREVDVTVK